MLITARKETPEFVKILDFGIAKLQVDQKQTATGTVLGTPLYMPPEQWEGKDDVDGRVDIYALGMILYQALTGTYPFDAKSAMQLMYAHTTKEVPDPGQRAPLPERLRQLVLAMLKKRPEDRPAAMAVVEAELLQVLAELAEPDASARPGSPADPPALLHPVAAGPPQPMAATADPVLSFTAQPSMTEVGPLADSWGVGAAVLPPKSASAAAPGPSPATGPAVRSSKLVPGILVGGAILALGATAAVGLTLARSAARARSGRVPTRSAVVPFTAAARADSSTAAARLDSSTRLVELGPGRLWVGRPAMSSAADGPAYAVQVARFAIEAYEVSAAQLAEYAQATHQSDRLAATARAAAGGSLPAVGVNREQAMRYCTWRHRGGRLPTEAEWEYAARDGRSDHLYPWSGTTLEGAGPAGSRANLGSFRAQLEPVDSHPTGATSQGVYNLLGNAAEWTLSDSTAYPGSRAIVPHGLAVVRGGSAITPVHGLLATTRQFVPATRTDPFIGFRCAVSGQ